MRFSDFPGLSQSKKNLSDVVKSGKIAHAHLFSSGEGGAAFPMALAFATLLNCENPTEDDSCGECPSCKKIQSFTHPDIHFSFPVTTTNQYSKSENLKCEYFLKSWRELLTENPFPSYQSWAEKFILENKLSKSRSLNIVIREAREIINSQALSAFEGKYKIFLIWNSERLNPNAENALLKILEEPTKGTIFILITHKLDRHLKTLLSRVQIHSIAPFKPEEVVDILEKKFSIEPEIAKKAGLISGGSISEALHISGSPNRVDFEKIQEWFRSCFSLDLTNLFISAEEFSNSNENYQRGIFLVGMKALENSLVSEIKSDDFGWSERLNNFFLGFLKNVGAENFEAIRKEMEEGLYLLDRNIQPRLLFLQKSLKLNQLMKSNVKN
jgi:DNA polymerase III subunit delta'